MPLTQNRGDRHDGLPRAQPARHNRHHRVLQNVQIRDQPTPKPWNSRVSPSGGMKETWIMGVTINSVSSTRRQAGAEYLLLHACPITSPGQKIPLPDPGIHTASGARLQHDGGRLVTNKLPEGRTIRVLFHACAVQKPILSLGCLAQQESWSDLRADTGILFFPDKIQTKHSQTQLHKEESLFFVKEMLVVPLSTAGVSDEVAQELQMPVGPQMLEDFESRCLLVLQHSKILALPINS